jgi:hypothetical protein
MSSDSAMVTLPVENLPRCFSFDWLQLPPFAPNARLNDAELAAPLLGCHLRTPFALGLVLVLKALVDSNEFLFAHATSLQSELLVDSIFMGCPTECA